MQTEGYEIFQAWKFKVTHLKVASENNWAALQALFRSATKILYMEFMSSCYLVSAYTKLKLETNDLN
jgi:hypothetical protein